MENVKLAEMKNEYDAILSRIDANKLEIKKLQAGNKEIKKSMGPTVAFLKATGVLPRAKRTRKPKPPNTEPK